MDKQEEKKQMIIRICTAYDAAKAQRRGLKTMDFVAEHLQSNGYGHIPSAIDRFVEMLIERITMNGDIDKLGISNQHVVYHITDTELKRVIETFKEKL